MSRLDRYGNAPDDQPDEHDCDNGWLGEDANGHPRPCLHCRPNLAPDRVRYRAGLDSTYHPNQEAR